MLIALENKNRDVTEHSVTPDGVEITITRYCQLGEGYNFSDKHLAGIYRRVLREKSIHKIFFDTKMANTEDFISYFKDKNLDFYFVSYNGQESGFFWLKKFFPRASFITYCLYKSFWGEHTLKISQTCIDVLFKRKDQRGNPEIDILMGLTPASNKLALKFLSKNGMKIVGNIPNLIWDDQKEKLVDGVLSYRHRENGGNHSRTILSLFSL